MKINFVNETECDVKKYEKLIKKIFKFEKTKLFFNLVFVDENRIKDLNRIYRQIDRVTDVITFALFDDPSNMVSGAENELGDVFICLKRAFEQASEYGHSIEREIGFLAVHGYLHLKGYDHQNPDDEKIMFEMQEDILNRAGLYRYI